MVLEFRVAPPPPREAAGSDTKFLTLGWSCAEHCLHDRLPNHTARTSSGPVGIRGVLLEAPRANGDIQLSLELVRT